MVSCPPPEGGLRAGLLLPEPVCGDSGRPPSPQGIPGTHCTPAPLTTAPQMSAGSLWAGWRLAPRLPAPVHRPGWVGAECQPGLEFRGLRGGHSTGCPTSTQHWARRPQEDAASSSEGHVPQSQLSLPPTRPTMPGKRRGAWWARGTVRASGPQAAFRIPGCMGSVGRGSRPVRESFPPMWPPEAWAQGATGICSERRKGLRRWERLGLQSQGRGLEAWEQSKERVAGREGGDPPRHPVLCWSRETLVAWPGAVTRGGKAASRAHAASPALGGVGCPASGASGQGAESPQRPGSSGWGTLRCPPRSLGIQGRQRSASKSVYFQVTF